MIFAIVAAASCIAKVSDKEVVLKCESSDKRVSEIIAFSEDFFAIWKDSQASFVAQQCNIRPRERNNGTSEGPLTNCTITPIDMEFTKHYIVSGFAPQYNGERLVEKFRVDRRSGAFTWMRMANLSSMSPIEFDTAGDCAITKKPEPPATKF